MAHLNFMLENYDTKSAEDFLCSIIKSTKSKPDIYDDSWYWEAQDAFEYWESAFGEYDNIIELVGDYCNRKCVCGWSSEESFKETEKMIPKIMKEIMEQEKSYIPYKKYDNKLELWQIEIDKYSINVLKFKNHANNNGTDYIEYWYMMSIDEYNIKYY